MTLQEVSLRLGKSEETIKNQFPRTRDNLAKKGIILSKVGKGASAEYFIAYEGVSLENEDEILKFLMGLEYKVYRGKNIFNGRALKNLVEKNKIQLEIDEDIIIINLTRACELEMRG